MVLLDEFAISAVVKYIFADESTVPLSLETEIEGYLFGQQISMFRVQTITYYIS